MKRPTVQELKAKARQLLARGEGELKGKGEKQIEVAVEAAALDVGWALAKRLGIIGATAAAAATGAVLLTSPTVQLTPGMALVQYVDQHAPSYGIDPAAALGVATMEGGGGGIGDLGTSFGPWQMHAGGALPLSEYFGPYSAKTQAWAWSSAGVDYALQHMGGVCHGARGYAAVVCIVSRFERPLHPAPEIAGAWRAYQAYAHDHTGLPKKKLPRRIRGTVHWFSHYFHVPTAGFHGARVAFKPQRGRHMFAPWRLAAMRHWAHTQHDPVNGGRHRLVVRFR